jgi:sec-independent protein translocase protein TatA
MHMNMLAFSWPGPFEMLCILGIGLLLFGSRLPEVGKSLGKTIVEFKKGMREIEDDNEADALERRRKAALADHSDNAGGDVDSTRQRDTVSRG